MSEYSLTADQITAYGRWLRQEEKTQATVEKYLRDIRAFARWLEQA